MKNNYIKDISFLPGIFKTDIFHFQHPEDSSLGDYYRPLVALSYMLDYHFWKLNPAGYHLVNIILHSLAGFLLYLLICQLFNDYRLALLTAILFSLNPIQVSNVAFISIRQMPMEMVFMLFSLLMSIGYWRTGKKINFFLAFFSSILALFCREDAVLLPLFIMLTGIILKINWRRLFFYSLPFIFAAAIYISLRSRFIPCDKLQISGALSIKSVTGMFFYLWDYLRQLMLPVGAQDIVFRSCAVCKYLLSVVTAVIVVFSLIKWLALKEKTACFGSIFYLIAMLPLVKLRDNILAFGPVIGEHYAYIASGGFYLLFSAALLYLEKYSKKIAVILTVAIIALYATLTVISTYYYKNDIVFYNYLLRLNPKQRPIRVNLGTAYLERKDYIRAYEQAALALRENPDPWDAYLLLGNIYKGTGNYAKAMEEYRQAIALYPRSSEAYNNLALIYRLQGKDEEAYENFKLAIQRAPESILVLKNFADFLICNKIFTEAIPLCEKILRLAPGDSDGYLLLGVALAEAGSLREAERALEAGLRIEPGSVVIIKNLAAVYANIGEFDKAISIWEGLLKKNPAAQGLKEDIERAKKLRDNKYRERQGR